MSEIERAEDCAWTETWDSWVTTCGKEFCFEDGTPTHHRFCHWCGGRVTLRPERRDSAISEYLDNGGRREDDEPISHPDRRSGADRRRA